VRAEVVGDTGAGKSSVLLPRLRVEDVLVAVKVRRELGKFAESASREKLLDGEEVGVPPASREIVRTEPTKGKVWRDPGRG
jgi:hypothetical protein